jgi:hypothetical protein
MLSVSARFPLPNNWTILNLNRNEHILVYTIVAEAWPDMLHARNRHDLFMFPPESVAHMAHSFSQVQACARRYALEAFGALRDAAPVLNDTVVHERASVACALRYHNHLLPAMLMLGLSIGPDEVSHEQCTLTMCSIQDGRELACMSWEHGLIFSARIAKQRVVLRATLATHEWPRVEGLSIGNIVPFSPMPLAEDTSVCISEFYELLKHGVCIEGHDVFVDVRQPKKPGARSLPCVLCPVVHWPVLLLLVEDGWTVPRRNPIRLRPSSEVFYEHSERFTVLTCLAGCARASVAGALDAFSLMEKIDENLLWEAVQRCLELESVTSLRLSTDGLQVLGIWAVHADSSLTFFASVAKLWYSMFVPGTGSATSVGCRVADTQQGTGSSCHTPSCENSATRQQGCAPTTSLSHSTTQRTSCKKKSSGTDARCYTTPGTRQRG